MRIVLLRHGAHEIANRQGLSAAEFGTWIDAFNQAGIRSRSIPTRSTANLAVSCQTKVCSNLRRSIDSMKRLCPQGDFTVYGLLREFELPHGNWKWLQLGAFTWCVIFRLLWFLGYSYGAESVSQAKCRARHATRLLTDEAVENQSVLFVGHYFINRQIAQNLIHSGWVGPAKPKRGHWEISIYKKRACTRSA